MTFSDDMQLRRDAEEVVGRFLGYIPEYDDFDNVILPGINGPMIATAINHAVIASKDWNIPKYRDRFCFIVAAEASVKLIEYQDAILNAAEPESAIIENMREEGVFAEWSFLQVCALFLSASTIATACGLTLKINDRPLLVSDFKSHLDRVAAHENTATKELADTLELLARESPPAQLVNQQESAQESSDAPTKNPRSTMPFWVILTLLIAVPATLAAVALANHGDLWPPSEWRLFGRDPEPTIVSNPPPFPQDGLAEVGMPSEPNALIQLSAHSDVAGQSWNHKTISGNAPGLSVPIDITPTEGVPEYVLFVNLSLKLRDENGTVDESLKVSFSGDFPLSIKEGPNYRTMFEAPGDTSSREVPTLQADASKNTPITLDKSGPSTFQFYVGLGDYQYQCGYHVRSLNAFVETQSGFPKIADSLPLVLLKRC